MCVKTFFSEISVPKIENICNSGVGDGYPYITALGDKAIEIGGE